MKTKFLICFIFFATLQCYAHEVRPALLRITQISQNDYVITWKIPRSENLVLKIVPVFPDWFNIQQSGAPVIAGDGALYSFTAVSTKDIHGMTIAVDGISESIVDVLVYVELLNGEKFSMLLQPSHPTDHIPQKETFSDTAKTFLKLGIEHILYGADHLLFVTALLLIVRGAKKIFFTITAFTLAHSLTLSLSVLGFVGLPGPPVEATIALSIMFLAWELTRIQKGEQVISEQKPWIVSFSFGLLHGLGFAGALQQVGLPQTQIPAALVFFNLGVEIGQLVFIFAMLTLAYLLLKFIKPRKWINNLAAYGIGSVAAFWLIQRVITFWR